MKRLENKSIKRLLLLIAIYVLVGLILYPLFDLIYCKLITNTNFVYSIQEDVIKPITIGLIMSLCIWTIEKK